MHCICNIMLAPWGWNFPCLGSFVCAHDALYLQSDVGALEVELPRPRVLWVRSWCTVSAISFCSLTVEIPMHWVLCVCSRGIGSAVKFSPALPFCEFTCQPVRLSGLSKMWKCRLMPKQRKQMRILPACLGQFVRQVYSICFRCSLTRWESVLGQVHSGQMAGIHFMHLLYNYKGFAAVLSSVSSCSWALAASL